METNINSYTSHYRISKERAGYATAVIGIALATGLAFYLIMKPAHYEQKVDARVQGDIDINHSGINY